MADPITWILGFVVIISEAIKYKGVQVAAEATQKAAEAQIEGVETAQEQILSDISYLEGLTAEEVGKFKTETEKLKARQRAAIGASGLQFTGSPLDVLQETEEAIEIDIARIEAAGEQRIQGLQTKYDIMETTKEVIELESQAVLASGLSGMAQSILGAGIYVSGLFPEYKPAAGPSTGWEATYWDFFG